MKIAVFLFLGLFMGCGLSFKFVAVPDESSFYQQNKEKLKKVGVAMYTRNDSISPCSILKGIASYTNDALPDYSFPDTMQLAMNQIFSGIDQAQFTKGFTGYGTWVSAYAPDSNIKQWETVLIPEEATGKTVEVLAGLCDKYQVDAIISGNYAYCVQQHYGSVRSVGTPMTAEYEPSTNDKEEVCLGSSLCLHTQLYSKADNKVLYDAVVPDNNGLKLNIPYSQREGDIAIRGKKPEAIAWKSVSRAIRREVDNMVIALGHFYRFEKAKPAQAATAK